LHNAKVNVGLKLLHNIDIGAENRRQTPTPITRHMRHADETCSGAIFSGSSFLRRKWTAQLVRDLASEPVVGFLVPGLRYLFLLSSTYRKNATAGVTHKTQTWPDSQLTGGQLTAKHVESLACVQAGIL